MVTIDKLLGKPLLHNHTEKVDKAGDTMTGNLFGNIPNDTKANILSSAYANNSLAYATDTNEILVKVAGAWYLLPFTLLAESSAPDMGYTQSSSRIGITSSYITDKLLANVDIGNAAVTTNASATRIPIRASGGTLQIYVSGAWQTIVSNFVFSENASYGYALEHIPVGFTYKIEIMSGNSLNNVGLNGLPIIQGYSVSQGAYPPVARVVGRSFT